MAWTGSAVVKKVSDRVVRVTGISLAADATGTIAIGNATGDIDISGLPEWEAYGDVTLIQAVTVKINIVTDVTAGVPISVVKTGTTQTDFLITFHNDTAADDSAELEIYIEFH